MANTTVHMPTAKELADAHEVYLPNVATDYVYYLATDLMRTDERAQGIMLLLIVWNPYFRYHMPTWEHFNGVEEVLREKRRAIADFAQRSISTMKDTERSAVVDLFEALDGVPGIGPTGAAKSVHLLAPDFFPLWDENIAEAYSSYDVGGYWSFMLATKRQYENVEREWRLDVGILKALDEYNYCKHTLDVL